MEWLEWESFRTGHVIRHQFNGSEKRLGKRRLPVDGWCKETKTVYQFHGCYWHGHDCNQNSNNTMNEKQNKSMVDLLEDTREITKYLRQLGVSLVEMWECEWKAQKKQNKEVKHFLDKNHRRRPLERKWEMTEQDIVNAIRNGTLFGMVECDIDVPEPIRDYFAEMQPIFKNAFVTRSDLGSFMHDYAETHNIMTLVGSYHGERILLATPLVVWYLEHGLVVSRVCQVIEYDPQPCFRFFGEAVSAARRDGNADPNKAIIADTMKLLGNSAYGKTVTNKDMQRDMKYCTDVVASRCINNRSFCQLDVVTDDVYEIEMAKEKFEYNLPIQIGFFVYQYAKLRMLQFIMISSIRTLICLCFNTARRVETLRTLR